MTSPDKKIASLQVTQKFLIECVYVPVYVVHTYCEPRP